MKKTPPITELSEGEKKLQQILQEEMKLDVHIYPIGDTMYLYAPTDKGFYDFKSAPTRPPLAGEYKNIYAVNHIDTGFEERSFFVDYDISINRAYPKEDPGYLTTTTEPFQMLYQKLFSAVMRAFGDLDGKDGRDKGPEFIVVVINDTTTGLHLKVAFHFEDYRKISTHALAHQEQSIRMIQEMRGDEKLVGDMTGKNLEYTEIMWGPFLAEQIKNRINVTIPKMKDLDVDINNEVSKLTYETLNNYEFKDYDDVVFRDLRTESIETLQKEELEKFKDQIEKEPEGRVYNLRFNYDPEKGITMEEIDNEDSTTEESGAVEESDTLVEEPLSI